MKLVISTEKKELTIVQNYKTYADYRFGGLSDDARQSILASLVLCPLYLRRSGGPLCSYLDVYLYLAGERVTGKTLSGRSMQTIASGFIGALHSKRFMDVGVHMRKTYARAFVWALSMLNPAVASPKRRYPGPDMAIHEVQLAAAFDAREFSEEKLRLLRGWWIQNKNGLRSHLPLYPMYERMGRAYTQRFYEACAAHTRGRVLGQLVAVRALIKFITEQKEVTEERLLDRVFVAKFWRDFLIYYSQSSYSGGDGMLASTIICGWNNQFIPLVRDALVPEGLFATPLGGYPNPRGKAPSAAASNVVLEDGLHIKTNLLTRVPLHLTDAQAAQTLFVDIRRDCELIRQWAEAEVLKTNSRIERRIALEAQGTPRVIQPVGTNTGGHKFISSRGNSQALANAAATLKKFGFVPRGTDGQDVALLFPAPLNETAQELGLPVTGSLVPYLAILVLEHPAITTSYLENFRLYNSAGVRIGLAKTDGGYYLVGDKSRRGAANAEQQIRLSDAALSAVEGLLLLTEPIRKYMRKRNDGDWCYLLLSCGKGFGKPYRISKLAPQTCFMERIRSIAAGIHVHCGVPMLQAQSLAKRFSLGRLRASAGTLVYLETQDVHKMAQALGHKSYQSDLLSRYLPPALEAFFQERWIRIFQNGILAEALKDSPHLLLATDFQTKEELASFLSRHALKLLPSDEKITHHPPSHSEVAFGLDIGIFTVLLGIERAVSDAIAQAKHPSSNALHWAAVTRELVKYVESKVSSREDLQEQLASAKRLADPSQMEGFIYA